MSLAETVAYAPAADGVMARLRQGTATAHAALEAGLDISARLADRDAMRGLLQRFWGFHAVWEPAVAAQLSDEAFFAPRRKLALLEADLAAVGLAADDVADLPVCSGAAPLPGYASALGSLYVLEGSTLGGQVISRMLRQAGWAEGLRYFDPYGTLTAMRWRAFRARAEAASAPAADAAMLAAANRTFSVLQAWLTGDAAA